MTKAEAEGRMSIVMKDEHDKEIERDEHEQSIKTLTIAHDQALKKLNNSRRIMDMLNLDKHR